jgi:cation:H+ antiporter
MVGTLIAYVWYSYWSEIYRHAPGAELHAHEADEFAGVTRKLWLGLAELGGGLAALVVGSRLLVTGASEIALSFGVPEAVIGLTLVALGTSLPELATSVMAAARGHADVAVGNVIGSNLFNSLGIIGITALVEALPVSEAIASFDIWVMLASALVLTVFLLWRGRIGRIAGGAFLAAYVVYIGSSTQVSSHSTYAQLSARPLAASWEVLSVER